MISTEAISKGIYTTGIDFAKSALDIYLTKQKLPLEDFLHAFSEPQINITQLEKDYNFHLKMHDEHLVIAS